MALVAADLNVLAYANGFTLWHYRTADAAESVFRSGYFDEAADLLRPGDIVHTQMGPCGQSMATLAVTRIADGRIAVAAMARTPAEMLPPAESAVAMRPPA